MNSPKNDRASAGDCCGGHSQHDHHDHQHARSGTAAQPGQVRDPVCGMMVDPQSAKYRAEHAGQPYYFCSAKCHERFVADPAKYLMPEAQEPAAAAPEGTIYTCPMHPQIRQVGPGSCPICGMALEPEVITGEHVHNTELADMTRRFWIGLVLSLPVLALEMGGHMTGLHQTLGAQTSNWIQLLLATPVVLWAGWPFFERAWLSLQTRNLNMFTLIAMGTGVAWLYSIVGTMCRIYSRQRCASTTTRLLYTLKRQP